MPRPSVAAVRITDGIQPSRAVSWNFRFATSTSSFPRSALFTTYTSPISRIPVFIVWTASPVIGLAPTPVLSHEPIDQRTLPDSGRPRESDDVGSARVRENPREGVRRLRLIVLNQGDELRGRPFVARQQVVDEVRDRVVRGSLPGRHGLTHLCPPSQKTRRCLGGASRVRRPP